MKNDQYFKYDAGVRKSKNNIPQHFRRPTFDASRTTLSVKLARWLVEERHIPQEVIARMRLTEQEEVMPQTGKRENCLCFNYFEEGHLVNAKYRDGQKNFKMVAGAELIPYNIDGIKDTPEAIITEGEFDALSFMTVGRTDVVSVPCGANCNLAWLNRFVETHFENKQVVYLAVDTDCKGVELAEGGSPTALRVIDTQFDSECRIREEVEEQGLRFGE